MTQGPIDTKYHGHRFRSRLEARWAVFFDTIGGQPGLVWEYEKEGYQFEDGSRYLPDFWIPGLNFWVEVKPDEKSLTRADIRVAENLHCLTNYPVLIAFGLPLSRPCRLFCTDSTDSGSAGLNWWDECQLVASTRGLRIDVGKQWHDRTFMNYDWTETAVVVAGCEPVPGILEYAAEQAACARFEFGEHGGMKQ